MNRKPLEGIEALMLAIGSFVGYFMAVSGFSFWILAISILILGIMLSKVIDILRLENMKHNS